jgi:hypothetical protein
VKKGILVMAMDLPVFAAAVRSLFLLGGEGPFLAGCLQLRTWRGPAPAGFACRIGRSVAFG